MVDGVECFIADDLDETGGIVVPEGFVWVLLEIPEELNQVAECSYKRSFYPGEVVSSLIPVGRGVRKRRRRR